MATRKILEAFTKDEGKKLIENAQEIISGKRRSKIKDQPEELLKKSLPRQSVEIEGKKANVVEGTTSAIKVDTKVKQPTISDEKADKILKAKSNLTPKQLSDFNIDKLDTREDIIKFIEEISQTMKRDINVRKRGVQTNEKTQELAEMMQMSPKRLMANLLGTKRGQTANAETILAAREVYVAAVNKLDDLAVKAEKGGTDELIEFRQHLALTSELQKIIKGLQTETARALQQFRIKPRNQEFRNVNLENLNKRNIIVEAGGAEEIQDIATFYLRTGRGKHEFIEKTGIATKISHALSEIFINSILSNPYTHVRNTAGNAITQGIFQLERKIGSAISRTTNGVTKGGLAEYENIAKNFGRQQAYTEMWAAMSKAIREKQLPSLKSEIDGNKIEQRLGAFTAANFDMKAGKAADFFDLAGKILTVNRIPTKFLTQADAFFKNMEYRSELYAIGYRKTLQQVRLGNLTKEDAPDYLAYMVKNPDEAMTKEARDKALASTFQTKLKDRSDILKLGANIQDVKSGSGAANFILNYYLPFIQTPTNVAGFVIERTPLFQFALKSFRDDIFGDNLARKQEAIAKIVLGHAAFATFAGMNYHGYLTGTNPAMAKDFKFEGSKRAMEKTLGIQTGSFVLGNEQYNLQDIAFDPLAMFVKMSADMSELMRMGFRDENELMDFVQVFTGFLYSFGENIGSSTFMAGIGKAVDDYQSFKDLGFIKGGKRVVKKAVPSFIPASSFVRQGNKLISKFSDRDYRKLAVDFDEYFLKAAYDRNLNPEYDLLGDKIETWGLNTTLKKDPIRDELRKLNPQVTPIRKGKSIDLIGGVPTTVEYTSGELSFMQKRAGEYYKQDLEEYFDSDDYNDPEIDLWEKREEVASRYNDAKQKAYLDLRGEGEDDLPAYRDFEGVRTRMDNKAKEQTISKIKTKNLKKPLNNDYEAIIDEVINDN